MFGIGTGELLLILVIAVLVVGPERMIQFAGQLGRWLVQFRQTTESVTKDFREAFSLEAGNSDDEADESASSTPSTKPISSQPESLSSPSEDSSALSRAEVLEHGQPEETSPAVLVDGEIESSEIVDNEVKSTAEPIVIEVAELVPEDQDAEPIALDQAVLIEESASEKAMSDGEG